MNGRYWAPAKPGIGPDAIDLELMNPSGDPRLDLGATLLAAHRVGAAACEAAAQTPMCDGTRLATYLARTRQELADPLVDSISKSVDGEAYAGLLTRDVLDDAERAAVDLFTAATSRGVPAPVAAQRVGAVYGVPSAELGSYRALATDPRAQPVAVVDAADRTLFAFIEKFTTAEATEGTRELVSKAPAAVAERDAIRITPDDPATPFYDARGAGGRFVATSDPGPSLFDRVRSRFGIAAPRVANAPAVVEEKQEAPAKTKPTVRERQQAAAAARAKRAGRAGRARAAAKPQTTQRTSTTTQAPARTKATGRSAKATAKVTAKQKAMLEAEVPIEFDEPTDDRDPLDTVQDSLFPYHRTISGKHTMVLNSSEMKYLLGKLEGNGTKNDPLLLRMHAISESLGLDPYEMESVGHIDQLRLAADEAHENMENPFAENDDVRFVTQQQIDESGLDVESYLEATMEEMAGGDEEEMAAITYQPVGDGDGYELVKIRSEADGGNPTVYEVVISGMRGHTQESGYGETLHLDKNQAYILSNSESFARYWDADNKVWVKRYYMQPVDDATVAEIRSHRRSMKKSASAVLVRTDDPSTIYYDARDAGGRFAGATATAAPTRWMNKPAGTKIIQDAFVPARPATSRPIRTTAARDARAARAARAGRAAAATRRPVQAPIRQAEDVRTQATTVADARVEARQTAMASSRAAVQQIKEQGKTDARSKTGDQLEFDWDGSYAVFSYDDFAEFLDATKVRTGFDAPSKIRVSAHRGLGELERAGTHGADGEESLFSAIYAQQYADDDSESRSVGQVQVEADGRDKIEFSGTVAAELRKPDVSYVEVEATELGRNNDGRWITNYEIRTNITKPKLAIVVEMAIPGAATTTELDLELVGRYRFTSTQPGATTSVSISTDVLKYRATPSKPGRGRPTTKGH